MPAKSKAQQRIMGAELARRRAGKTPRLPSMTTTEVRDYASTPRKGLPPRKSGKK